MATLEHVGNRQAEFSQTANALKTRLTVVRWICFGLSIAGATLAAIAGGLPTDEYRNYLAWPAAAALAISAFVTGRLLTKDAVKLQVKARMAAEALKRETYLYATSAVPYNDPDPAKNDAQLTAALNEVTKNTQDLAQHKPKTIKPGSCPRGPLTLGEYTTKRLDGQINYYTNTANKLTTPSRALHVSEFTLAGVAAVITAIAAHMGKGKFDIAPLTAVITTLAGTVLAHLAATRYDDQIASYRAAADRLSDLKATIVPGTTVAELAKATEEIVTNETQSWQAGWLK
ncbi:MAG: DUF4231 domain-containing protein [Reyranella sp.]|nr:DUF4231 domain-containing protein [Reyranella sp.]MBL6653802.1 DUF4231 domain-containing protein [Reyranella sp.]